MVRKVLTGVSYLMAVPNGGIGPQFSGVLARSVKSPDYDGPLFNVYELDLPQDIFNGTGEYSNWRWNGYPSTDQYSGIIFGLTRTALLVSPHDSWIRNLTQMLTQQIIEHFIKTNWRIIDNGARTTGQQFSIGLENAGYWVLALLKMAQVANPQIHRYSELYHHYAIEREYSLFLNPPLPLELFNLFNICCSIVTI